MRTQHVFDHRNLNKGRDAFVGPWNHASFKGDYRIEASSIIEVEMHRRSIGACSVIHARSRTPQSFRRTWSHIREDATDVVVLCFVTKGCLRMQHASGEIVAQAGEFLATRSIAPFYLECGIANDKTYEALHLIAPTHFLRQHLSCEVNAAVHVPATGRNFAIAKRLLADLVEDQGELHEASARLLVDAALATLADAIKGNEPGLLSRPTSAALRLQAVLRHIDLHLSDPKLSVSSVAAACNMSARSIFSLFQRQGTKFSAIVWSKRLNVAAQWLSTSSSGDAPIREIAHRVGFKSSAHFARMFKREFDATPRSFRSAGLRSSADGFESLLADGGALRLHAARPQLRSGKRH